MSEDEDLELLALQRQLDDAFQTTRPRRDFEDELWLRMQSRRPIWRRVRDGVAGLVEGIRESPAVPSAAVAVAVIRAVGGRHIHVGRARSGRRYGEHCCQAGNQRHGSCTRGSWLWTDPAAGV